MEFIIFSVKVIAYAVVAFGCFIAWCIIAYSTGYSWTTGCIDSKVKHLRRWNEVAFKEINRFDEGLKMDNNPNKKEMS